MKNFNIILILTLLLMYVGIVHAYKQDTHKDMSEASVKISVLKNDPKVLENLGLEPWDKEQTFQIALTGQKTITQHIRDGANFEDSGVRSQYHFFDPTRGTGLFGTTIPSPDWALEDKGDINGQEFSYKRARQYFYGVLTKGTRNEREASFSKLFETLGRVIHHLQDMTQPQHVRNDIHPSTDANGVWRADAMQQGDLS